MATYYLLCSLNPLVCVDTESFLPADDETDIKALEASVRGIEKDGLVWGASKLVPVGYGVSKLQISLVVEDEKISLQDLEDEIAGFEDYVQSTDIVSSQPNTPVDKPGTDCAKPRLLCKSCNCSCQQGFSIRTGHQTPGEQSL